MRRDARLWSIVTAALVLVLALAACGSEKDETAGGDTATAAAEPAKDCGSSPTSCHQVR